MKFMLTTRAKDSYYALSPEKMKKLQDASAQYFEKFAKEGMLKEAYYLGNMKGAMVIFDLNSQKDLVRIAYESPAFTFVDAEITPLVDMDVVRKAQKKK